METKGEREEGENKRRVQGTGGKKRRKKKRRKQRRKTTIMGSLWKRECIKK